MAHKFSEPAGVKYVKEYIPVGKLVVEGILQSSENDFWNKNLEFKRKNQPGI